MKSDASEVAAVAFELLDALHNYEQHVDALVGTGWDPDLYMRASDYFEQMRLCAPSLTKAQVAWIELLISRFEMSQALWSARHAEQADDVLVECHARHKGAIDRLRRKLTQVYLFPAPIGTRPRL